MGQIRCDRGKDGDLLADRRMTKGEHGRLKAELFGLQVLVMQCMCFIAARVEDPVRFLKDFGDAAVDGIRQAGGANVPPQQLARFQDAAASVIVQCVEAAQNAAVGLARRPMGMRAEPTGPPPPDDGRAR